jgi:hypothetical protein
MFVRIIKLFFVIIMLINISLSFDANDSNASALVNEYKNHLSFFQLYEDCFNGIDDDGDKLIDRDDVFDC